MFIHKARGNIVLRSVARGLYLKATISPWLTQLHFCVQQEFKIEFSVCCSLMTQNENKMKYEIIIVNFLHILCGLDMKSFAIHFLFHPLTWTYKHIFLNTVYQTKTPIEWFYKWDMIVNKHCIVASNTCERWECNLKKKLKLAVLCLLPLNLFIRSNRFFKTIFWFY